jgi:hypothetical protein
VRGYQPDLGADPAQNDDDQEGDYDDIEHQKIQKSIENKQVDKLDMETALKMEKESRQGQRPKYKFTEEEKQAYIDALGTNWLQWDRK